jgi:hypothetical protein
LNQDAGSEVELPSDQTPRRSVEISGQSGCGAANVQARENTNLISLADSKWKNVAATKSRQVFTDSKTGNAISRAGAGD